MRNVKGLLVILLFATSCVSNKSSFKNPLLASGADPWSIFKDKYYYYTHTTGDRINIWKTKNLSKLKHASTATIFLPPAGTPYSKNIWAPEIHFIDNKWYVYFAADDGKNENHRMYVLENQSQDPFTGTWELKGRVADSINRWAIDGSVFKYNDTLYMIWSGWEGNTNGQQDIYISKMKNPWTIDGHRIRISSPIYAWERHGQLNDANNPPHVAVNEGPQFLRGPDKLFIVYSGSGCWTDHYGLGLLSASPQSNLLDSASWFKHPHKVFGTDSSNSVFAPGHNSFFVSPNGRENWILYHANSRAGEGCGGRRSPRAQKFTWNSDGTPNFGRPVKAGARIKAPK
jgi:GH43 family beta-xylosidase